MSISSVSNSSDWWTYLNNLNSTSTTKSSSSDAFSLSSTKTKTNTSTSTTNSTESEQLDSATLLSMLTALSGGTQNISSTTTDSEVSSEINDFLDKVAAGTVTDENLTAMQSTLSSLMPPPPPKPAEASSETSSTSTSSIASSSAADIQSTIESFLDKVAAGTVTDEDLSAMQVELASAQSDTTAAYGKYATAQDNSALLQQLLSVASNAYENSYQTNSQQSDVWAI